MKTIIANTLRRAANGLNNLAEKIDPAVETAKKKASQTIARAKQKAAEARPEVRRVMTEAIAAGECEVIDRPVQYFLWSCLWGFLEGFAVGSVMGFIFGPTLGFIATMATLIFTFKAMNRRAHNFACLLIGRKYIRKNSVEVCHA